MNYFASLSWEHAVLLAVRSKEGIITGKIRVSSRKNSVVQVCFLYITASAAVLVCSMPDKTSGLLSVALTFTGSRF